MRAKKKDVPYCGIRVKKVWTAKPKLDAPNLKQFMLYLRFLHRVDLQKAFNLQKGYRSKKEQKIKSLQVPTLVYQYDPVNWYLLDKVSYNNMLTYKQKLLNVILFRCFGRSDVFEWIGGPLKVVNIWATQETKDRLTDYPTRSKRYNHSEFFATTVPEVRALKKHLGLTCKEVDFEPHRVVTYLDRLRKANFFGTLGTESDQSKTYLHIRKRFPPKFAYQLFVDFTHIDDFPFSDNEFVLLHDISKKALKYLVHDKDDMTDLECLFWIRDNWEDLKEIVGPSAFFDPKKELATLPNYDKRVTVNMLERALIGYMYYK